MISRDIPRLTIVILLCINIALALYATPVTDCGDAGSYIELSKKFLGEKIELNMAHRSPLFSMLLALVIKTVGIPLAFKITVYIQYCLVFSTSLMIYSLFKRMFKNPLLPFIISILFNLSFSTIYFANILLTEILTVFLLFVSLYFLMKYFDSKKFKYLILLGLSVGLLSLARFNAIPIIFSFLAILSYLLFIEQKNSLKNGLFSIIGFLIPYLFILNLWSFYNLNQNGFYGLLPGGGILASRNAIVASINPRNKVDQNYQTVLDIFIKARDVYSSQEIADIKGSLSSSDKYGILENLHSGYAIYMIAYPDLIKYFNLKDTDGEYQMNNKLNRFYKEIANGNSGFIWKLRLYSLLNSFRASISGILPFNYGGINLNILPPFIIKLNKLINFFISISVFATFFFFIFKLIKNYPQKPDFILLVMFIIVFSFWGINFVFATAADANRFKFPAEPLIIGLFIYYVREIFQWFIKFKQPGTNHLNN
jgi:4-amino-4-deoxy-L-arabinose transferase-like glycosyltransferase